MTFPITGNPRQSLFEGVLVRFYRQRQRQSARSVAAGLSPQLRADIGLTDDGDLIERETRVRNAWQRRR